MPVVRRSLFYVRCSLTSCLPPVPDKPLISCKRYTVRDMGGVNIQLQSFLIFALVEGEWLTSHHDLFDLGIEPLVSTEYVAWWGMEKRNIYLPVLGIEPRFLDCLARNVVIRPTELSGVKHLKTELLPHSKLSSSTLQRPVS